MKCTNPQCGADNPEEARFCESCGASLAAPSPQAVCPHCGRANKSGYKFCRGCGKPALLERVCPACGAKGFNEEDVFCDECGTRLSATDRSYASCQVGEHFLFGAYPQGANGEEAPVEWRVLARESGRMLVIAEYGLDAKAYNEEDENTDWSRCTLRSWLNGVFFEEAFKEEERGSLLEVALSNPDSPADWHNVPGGPDTCDKVFLLSREEAGLYFSGASERCCTPTAYAFEQGAWLGNNGSGSSACWWWLRSPGSAANLAADVYRDGSFTYGDVSNDFGVIRPAMYLAL